MNLSVDIQACLRLESKMLSRESSTLYTTVSTFELSLDALLLLPLGFGAKLWNMRWSQGYLSALKRIWFIATECCRDRRP
jgi:hypothetical protein